MTKPANPYVPGTFIYRIMDEDWSTMTKKEIAEAIGSTYKNVTSSMWRIKDETGYDVPYVDRRSKWRNYKN